MSKNVFEIDKTNAKVEFNIIGDAFNPDIVTQKLKINPTEVWIKGEQIKGKDLYRKYTLWSISTEYEESLDINYQLKAILSVLTPKTCELLELKNTLDIEYRFCVVININNNENPAMYIDTGTIRFINEITAEIDFDLYIYS